MNCKHCIDDLEFKIKIADIETKCKYHKRKGIIYSSSSLSPKGMCRELFYAIYPECLSVLYNGLPVRGRLRKKGMQETIAICPAPEGIKVRIRSEEIFPPAFRILKELIEELCKKFYRAFDAPFRRVFIEVIQTNFNCPKNYKLGDIFMFNINKKDELCPAGFFTLYPYLRLLKNCNKQSGLPHSIYVHCPDYVGVTYEVIVD